MEETRFLTWDAVANIFTHTLIMFIYIVSVNDVFVNNTSVPV